MPSIQEHMARDEELLGALPEQFKDVHLILDQFAHYPDWWFLQRHRKFLHHEEGIEYIRRSMGEPAARAAEQHVRDDCGGLVPKMADYHNGKVDEFGCEIVRPPSAFGEIE